MKEKLKIWHISDTHAHHHLLEIPENIDLVVFSGDESNNHIEKPFKEYGVNTQYYISKVREILFELEGGNQTKLF